MEITYDSHLATWDDARYTWDGVFIPVLGPLRVDPCYLDKLAQRRFVALRTRREYVSRAVCAAWSRRVNAVAWPPKTPAEVLTATFDFADEMDSGETIEATEVECQTVSGIDPAPGLVLYGPHTVDAQKILQPFSGGISGVTYTLRCTVTLSSGRVLVCAGRLPVRAL